MNEAPKKIWVSHMTHTAYEYPIDGAPTTQYIRIDHVNGIKTDNSIKNLRIVSNAENGQNINNPRTRNVSGFLGACYDKRHDVYTARIMVDGKQLNLGTYKTAKEAHVAYLKAKSELHPKWNGGFAEKHHGITDADL